MVRYALCVSTMRERADPGSLTDLDAAWEQFFAAVRRARGRVARTGAEDTLTLSQYVLLLPLLEEGPLPVGELAGQASIAAPTATRALDGLARRGLVRRTPSQRDRRCVVVCLTEEGERVLRARRDTQRRRRAAILRELDPVEREQAGRLLGRLADLLDTL
jgi:DNA-binding MarR family transcriptional regulator